MANKKIKQEEIKWDEEQEVVIKPKKKLNGAYAKRKGNNYELKIVKELREITGDLEISTARAESKSLDDAKIDIFDPNDSIGCYVQCKSTQVTPSIKKINAEVGKKDKPLAIFWNAQEKCETNCKSVGEYVIIPKSYFYSLIEKQIE